MLTWSGTKAEVTGGRQVIGNAKIEKHGDQKGIVEFEEESETK